MRGLRILSHFRDKLDKFNDTGARLLGSLLYDPKITLKSHLEIAWNYALMLQYNHMRNHYGRYYIALPEFVNH